MTHPSPIARLRDRLRTDLTDALVDRDRERRDVIRALLSALDNAEAVDPITVVEGRTEVSRPVLGRAEVEDILRGEAAELESAASDYSGLGREDEAGRLRRRAEIVAGYLSAL